MNTLQTVQTVLVAFTAFLFTGCEARGETTIEAIARPSKGWTSECLGRVVVDLPGAVKFGRGRPGFYSNGKGRYFGDEDDWFVSEALVNAIHIVEGSGPDGPRSFDLLEESAANYFKISVIRDGGREEKEAQRAAATTKQPWRDPRSFIWRSGPTFDFGVYVPADRRSRMLHGKMSGDGSPAQARAVVDALWPRYRVRAPGEIPKEPGICTPYGFFADPKGLTERDYAFDMSFRDSRHSNLILKLQVETRNDGGSGKGAPSTVQTIDDLPTPWALEDARSKEERDKCRAPQGTGTRDIFGCTFAGTKAIKRHRDVEYLALADGQRARLLVIEYHPSLHGYAEYEVRLQALGLPDSATAPRLEVRAIGIPARTTIKGMQGLQPPKIDEAVMIVRTIAASLRLRTGAVDPAATVRDSLAGVR